MISSALGKTVTFKNIPLLERDTLVTHLLNNAGALKGDLRFLGPFTSINNEFLLGVNKEKRLQIVEVERDFEENLLYRSLAHLQWVLKSTAIRDRAAQQFDIDSSLMPGIIYVLPGWADEFPEVFGFLSPHVQIQIVRYRYLASDKEHGFLFEPEETKRLSLLREEKDLLEVQIDSLKEQAGLTHEEIMSFLE